MTEFNPGKWPELRALGLSQAIGNLRHKRQIRFTFSPSTEADFIKYFSASFFEELKQRTLMGFRYVQWDTPAARPDIVIITAHGGDLSSVIWDMREKLDPRTLIVVWLWDNHLAWHTNLRTILASDFVFFSHSDEVNYLATPASVLCTHVPACTAQWTREEARQYFDLSGSARRKSKLLVNYVDYGFASRGEILRTLQSQVPQADVMMMPSDDRTRYFDKSPEARFREWASYKATIILPMTTDLSTRFFDAMLAGMVPIIADCITDLDKVISPEMQQNLGVIRLGDFDAKSLRSAARQALKKFDELGIDGVVARHRYACDGHMLTNRVHEILRVMRIFAKQQLKIEFGDGPHGVGLYPTDPDP